MDTAIAERPPAVSCRRSLRRNAGLSRLEEGQGAQGVPRAAGTPRSRKSGENGSAYVQLVCGRQLQQPADEQPADPLDVASMSREERDALKRRILMQHPHLVAELRGSERA